MNHFATKLKHQQACRLRLGGQVQGVGFRPFVFRMARQAGLQGWVRNCRGEVQVHAQGEAVVIERFIQALLHQAPAVARPVLLTQVPVPVQACKGFDILPSDNRHQAEIHVPTDYAVCPDCLAEMTDPQDRRYRYPFINCTRCGPRYTLIHKLPYDRANTGMAGFALCAACQKEYTDPEDRRFHAQPVACADCGPQLSFSQHGQTTAGNEAALQQALALLRQDGILAVKGIGGYHFMCDARSDVAVRQLRQRKQRPHKPLAVMFPASGEDELGELRQHVQLTAKAEELLRDPHRPILLLEKRRQKTGTARPLSYAIAPATDSLGVILPYSPLHYLLLQDFAAPLVATSANLSGEPVISDNQQAEQLLTQVADGFLHHDRPILHAADDSVFRIMNNRAMPLRLGRGTVPVELSLPRGLASPMLAVGGHMKNTVALAWGRRLVISAHVGDLDSPRSLQHFQHTITHLQNLYGVRAELLVCDAHPDYASRRWVQQQGLPWISVFHHHAHASAVVLEQEDGTADARRPWLVFTWDGAGYGEDGTLWGGEALLGRPGHWLRVASFRPFHLPGGEKAGRQAWRSAAALCWEAEEDCPVRQDLALLYQAWQKRFNCPTTTSVGRLFDAVAAITGQMEEYSFEGQGPLWLETLATEARDEMPLPLQDDEHGVLQADWAALLPLLQDDSVTLEQRVSRFHGILAATLTAQADRLRERHGDFRIGLAGGVFQNRRLVEQVFDHCQRQGFEIHMNRQIPCNDGGLCAGQILEAATRSGA